MGFGVITAILYELKTAGIVAHPVVGFSIGARFAPAQRWAKTVAIARVALRIPAKTSLPQPGYIPATPGMCKYLRWAAHAGIACCAGGKNRPADDPHR